MYTIFEVIVPNANIWLLRLFSQDKKVLILYFISQFETLCSVYARSKDIKTSLDDQRKIILRFLVNNELPKLYKACICINNNTLQKILEKGVPSPSSHTRTTATD